MLTAWVLYPLVLLALCAGLGLLVDALAGRRLPGVLIPVAGLAAIVVVGQFTTLADATAELTMPLLLVLALAGFAFSLPWRRGRLDPWPVAVAVAVFAVYGAPVVLSGEPTFAGFIRLDDTATWLALTDRVMEHGRSLDGLAPSTYRATLDFNLASGYPVGVFLPFGAAQKLVGGDLAWVFQPYVAFLAAMLSLSLWKIVGGIVRRPGLRALVVFVAAQPALLYGYSLWGGVKEVAAAAFVALAVALAPAAVRRGARPRDVAPLALAAGALVGVLSLGGLIWLAPMLVVLAVLAVRRFGSRGALGRAFLFALLLTLLVIPAVTAGLVPPTSSPLTDPNAEGNLRGALNPLQVLGIWPTGDFRFDPDVTVLSAVLIALGAAAAGVGLWLAWVRRNAALLLYASSLIACAAVVAIGSPWAGGKVLATASPVALSLALVGVAAALTVDRLAGAVLIAAVVGGVLWSNALAYRDVSLAPYDQLVELEQIGERFAGQGPALMTEYNPYGARHFLREVDAEGASELRVRPVPLRGGGEVEKGEAVDTDQLDLDGLLVYRTLVLRRSPVRSRPPLPYRLVWAGEDYEVWQRPAESRVFVGHHLPLGGPLDPAAVPNCSEVAGLGQLALLNRVPNPRLVAVSHAPVLAATDGRIEVERAGPYVAWLEGSVRGRVELLLDGRKVGEARSQLNNAGGFVRLGRVRLTKGVHDVALEFDGADLHPGSGPPSATGPLLFSPAGGGSERIVSVGVDRTQELCGRRWDWIEAVGG